MMSPFDRTIMHATITVMVGGRGKGEQKLTDEPRKGHLASICLATPDNQKTPAGLRPDTPRRLVDGSA